VASHRRRYYRSYVGKIALKTPENRQGLRVEVLLPKA
jgi:hypothetical protein